MLDLYLKSYVADLKWTLDEIDRDVLVAIADVFLQARRDGRQILVVGNGGSAATASHLACDLGKGTVDWSRPDFTRFRVLSLADNNALMTALGNDISFEEVFAEQLRIVMRQGDVVVLISASGNSPNLVRALEYAKANGAITVGLLGFGGGRLGQLVDHALVVTSRNYGIAEDFHLIVQHVLTQYLRRVVADPPRPIAFLDRDGIINERAAPHEYIERWEQFRFVAGVVPVLRELTARGYALVVVTNQQCIGKGRIGVEDLRQLHARMTDALAAEGVTLSGIFYCPHLESDGCFCRKPKPGLIQRALNEINFQVDLEASILLGDSEGDMVAAQAAGLKTRMLVASPASSQSAATHTAPGMSEVLDRLAPALARASVGMGSRQ